MASRCEGGVRGYPNKFLRPVFVDKVITYASYLKFEEVSTLLYLYNLRGIGRGNEARPLNLPLHTAVFLQDKTFFRL